MTKKEYMKPEMQVVKIQQQAQILAGSVENITSTGLDEELILPNDGLPGSTWDDAM